MYSTVKKCCSRLSLPVKTTVVFVMERYELTFTTIVAYRVVASMFDFRRSDRGSNLVAVKFHNIYD